MVEALEARLLLSADLPVVTDIVADNRGLVELTVSRDLQASTVNTDTVQIFTAGSDGLLGTADDRLAVSQVSYDQVNRVIRINASIDADERYKVDVDGSRILGVNGHALDGEFNGPGMDTGDGVAGGDLVFFTRPGVETIVRFTTVAGDIDVELFPEETPLTVENFFNYMNRGDWDGTFFHRSVMDFVIQGGGFDTDATFSRIPTDPPVQNEPGISNLRGTIAMAKLGNDPNSATNQWFFNLGDNSANLDQQNGGFTVFGQIIDRAGLRVMDDIAAFETVDATGQGSAFSDLPVRDLMEVEDRNGVVVPSDVIEISRIARLFEITGEPFRQLPTEGLVQVRSGDAMVSVWSLEGVQLGRLYDFLDIRFGRDDAVTSIRVVGEIPHPIGIQISGASDVGMIQDRGDAGDNLRFIVSNTSIDRVMLRGSMIGTDLNGVLLADGLLMNDDVDGDGVLGDDTAIFVERGYARIVSIGEDLGGSVLTTEGMGTMTVGGRVSDASLLLGEESAFRSSSFRFGEVSRTSIESAAPISRLQTGEWRSGGTIEAPAIASLQVRGGRDASGDMTASLDLTGRDVDGPLLRSASIGGAALRSTWLVRGDVGVINAREGAVNWTLDARGDVARVMLGPVATSSVIVSGDLGAVRATEWIGGRIQSMQIVRLQIQGSRDAGGDLFADVNVRDVAGTSIRSLSVSGDIRDAEFRLRGDIRSWRVGGDLDGLDMRVSELPRNLRLNSVSDTSIRFVEAGNIRVKDWVGGSLDGGGVQSVMVQGDRRDGIVGDFLADVSVRDARVFFVAGDLRGDATFRRTLGRMEVRGDVTDSNVVFEQAGFQNLVGDVLIDGAVVDSEIRGEGFVGTVVMGAMFNSTLALGTLQPGITSFPETGASFQPFTTDAVIVRGLDDGQVAMRNSYILGGVIDFVRVMRPDTSSSQVFGVAALQINDIRTALPDGTTSFLSGPTEPVAFGTFDIRPGFVAPDV